MATTRRKATKAATKVTKASRVAVPAGPPLSRSAASATSSRRGLEQIGNSPMLSAPAS
jgi:hypothetical protein